MDSILPCFLKNRLSELAHFCLMPAKHASKIVHPKELSVSLTGRLGENPLNGKGEGICL